MKRLPQGQRFVSFVEMVCCMSFLLILTSKVWISAFCYSSKGKTRSIVYSVNAILEEVSVAEEIV